jgi:hypothetical protein
VRRKSDSCDIAARSIRISLKMRGKIQHAADRTIAASRFILPQREEADTGDFKPREIHVCGDSNGRPYVFEGTWATWTPSDSTMPWMRP